MKSFTLAVVALLCGAVLVSAQDFKLPTPQKEHEWLQQFVGEWDSEFECMGEPGQPPMKGKGTESTRMIGGFWVVAQGKGEIMGMNVENVLTLGYDPGKKKYIGTWLDSMSNYLWKYEGTVDVTGKILTLETEGPFPPTPDKIVKFKEVTEFKDKDNRVFTSSMQGPDGKWTKIVTVTSRRKK